jgi:hypothetical protein
MLNPFFSYFGSKYRLAKYYPQPQYDIVIEPFAGSAGYSLLYPEKQVILYEIYQPIVELWDYLIHARESRILSLPVGPFHKDYPIDKEDLCPAERTLLGLWLTESQTVASRYPLSRSRGGNWTERKKATIAAQLPYIRHWKVECLSFEAIPNQKATWFVDPPYQQAGKRYKFNQIDYDVLGAWCLDRKGQTIVCEQEGAKWLDFQHKIEGRNASNRKYHEIYYANVA